MNAKSIIKLLKNAHQAATVANQKRDAVIKQVGRALRTTRMDANIKQITVAKRMKKSQPFICFIEGGDCNLTPEIAERYLKALEPR